jgi:Tfp pilus assembly protein FimV
MRTILAVLAAGALLSAPGLGAQTTHTVAKGETVVSIVHKLKYPEVTESQMYYALVRANINTFSVDTVERVAPGMKLRIPAAAEVRKIDVKTADAYMASLRRAEAIYQEGVAAENRGDMKTALERYLASANIGHALADLKLGQLYDKDVTRTLPHDLQKSIAHYQKARERGRDQIEGPGSRAPQLR